MKAVLAALAAAVFAGTLVAAPITIVGGSAGSVPNSGSINNAETIVFGGSIPAGYFGAQIDFDGQDLLIEYFGAEAGYTNNFIFDGSTLYTHVGGTGGAAGSFTGAPLDSDLFAGSFSGPAPFSFSGSWGSVANGSNPDWNSNPNVPNFFVACIGGGTSCGSAWVLLDDGGAGPDDNHDDMIIRLTVQPSDVVPEPGTFVLMGLGLLGAGFIARRKRA
jgi:hypothetical protein